MPKAVTKKRNLGPPKATYSHYAYISRGGRGIQPTFNQAQNRGGDGCIIVGFQSDREAKEFILNGTVMYNELYAVHNLAEKSDVTCVHMEVREERDPVTDKKFHILRAWSKPEEPMHAANLTQVLKIPPPVTYPRLLLYAAYLTVETFKGAQMPTVIFRDIMLYRALKEGALSTGRDTQQMWQRLTRVKELVSWVYVPDLSKVVKGADGKYDNEGKKKKKKEKKKETARKEGIDTDVTEGGQPADSRGDTGGGGVQEVGGQDAAVPEGGGGSRPADLHEAAGHIPEE